jgi:squalene-associated FAD-dependent desaturase
MSAAPEIVVVGAGLAGMAAALRCADSGARVTLLEKRTRLGGLTWSFTHDGLTMDNGQHVFLRCCTAYLDFLDRVGSAGDVHIQDRLDVAVVRNGRTAVIRRDRVVAPLHLARSLLSYSLVPWAERARIGLAAAALGRLDLDDPSLDEETFEHWLVRHHQGPAAISHLWELICLATVNLPSSQASLAMAAKVFQAGLLTDASAGDIGWSTVPLGQLHGARGEAALAKAGVAVHKGEQVQAVTPLHPAGAAGEAGGGARFVVRTATGELTAEAVVVALPHYCVEDVLPAGALHSEPARLGSSPIVNVHVHFDRKVTDLSFAAGEGMAQWVFDRTEASGAGRGQYLAVSVSGADEYIGGRRDQLGHQAVEALGRMFPRVAEARVLSTLVTREHHATFRAEPGSSGHREPSRTRLRGLALAGAWTSTGWPPTMEGAVRSGLAGARVALAATRTAGPGSQPAPGPWTQPATVQEVQ